MTDAQSDSELRASRLHAKEVERRFYIRYFGSLAVFAAGAIAAVAIGPYHYGWVTIPVTALVVGGLLAAAIVAVRAAGDDDNMTVELEVFTRAAAASFCILYVLTLGYAALRTFLSLPDVPTPVFAIVPSLLLSIFTGYYISKGK